MSIAERWGWTVLLAMLAGMSREQAERQADRDLLISEGRHGKEASNR